MVSLCRKETTFKFCLVSVNINKSCPFANGTGLDVIVLLLEYYLSIVCPCSYGYNIKPIFPNINIYTMIFTSVMTVDYGAHYIFIRIRHHPVNTYCGSTSMLNQMPFSMNSGLSWWRHRTGNQSVTVSHRHIFITAQLLIKHRKQ